MICPGRSVLGSPGEVRGQARLFPIGEAGPVKEPPRCETCGFLRREHRSEYTYTADGPGKRTLVCPMPAPEAAVRLGFYGLSDALRATTGIEPEVWNTGGSVMCLALPLERGPLGIATRYVLFSELEDLDMDQVSFHYYNENGSEQEAEGVEFVSPLLLPEVAPGETWSDHPQLCEEVAAWAKPLIHRLKGDSSSE